MKKFLLLLAVFGFCFAAQVHAEDAETIKTFEHVPKLNREVKISKEDFEAKTKFIQETPLGNQFLAYQIRLGKDWQKLDSSKNEQGDLSKQILGDVSIYLGPPNLDLRSSFRLRANDLPFDVTAKDWFLNYMLINNYNLQGLEINSDKKVQAQYMMVENGTQSVVRAVAQISGSHIILAEYDVPIELWPTESGMAKRSMSTFYIENNDATEVEPTDTYSFVDIAKFNYPKSWILTAAPVTSIERMNASITNLKGGIPQKIKNSHFNPENLLMDGRVDISVVAKSQDTNMQQEVQLLKNQMTAKGLVLGDLIEPVTDWAHNDGITFSRIEAYKLNNTKSKLADSEYWIGLFETPGRIYLVRLLTVGRTDNYLTWARNVQAFRNVIATLSPVKQ